MDLKLHNPFISILIQRQQNVQYLNDLNLNLQTSKMIPSVNCNIKIFFLTCVNIASQYAPINDLKQEIKFQQSDQKREREEIFVINNPVMMKTKSPKLSFIN